MCGSKMSKPSKGIKGADDMLAWEKSEAYNDILGMISAVGSAIKGKKMSCEYHISEASRKVANVIDELSLLVDKIPPEEQPQRFGNKAFRAWRGELSSQAPDWVSTLLDDPSKSSERLELIAYLEESFGNSFRIDYGTGHELMFAAFLCCLFKLKVLLETDVIAVAFLIFDKYVNLCRKLQRTYRMEPAGSQGVWSLDDYQFIPFIWGSSQLIGNIAVTPRSIPKPDIAESMYKDFMFFACIRYINETKTGPFSEHSSTLYSISGVAHWEKVYTGSIKMYKAEVLAKFPVVQHFLFGNLLTLKPSQVSKTESSSPSNSK